MPYFLAPTLRGERVYALLRETLRREKKIGIAYVVIQTRQHLAALIPGERVLMLNTLRWSDELRSPKDLDLPAAGIKGAGLRDNELRMAAQLVKDMSARWEPDKFHDSFREDILALAKRKVARGKVKNVEGAAEPEERPSAKVIELTELLRQSLRGRQPPAGEHRPVSSRPTHGRSAHARKSRSKAPAPRKAAAHRRPASA